MNYAILGGIGKGISEGLKDVDEYQKTKFLREQEGQKRQEWEREAENQEFLREQRGRTRKTWAEEDDKKAKQQAVFAKHAARLQAIQNRDANVLAELSNYYNMNVPDNYQVLYSSTPDGGLNVAFMEEKSGKVVNAKRLTPQQAQMFAMQASKDMLNHELSALGLSEYAAAEKLAIDRGELGAKQATAGAAARNAAVNEAELGLKRNADTYGAQAARDRATGAAAVTSANAQSFRATAEDPGQVFSPGVGPDGVPIYFQPVRNKLGIVENRPVSIPPGTTPMKTPRTLDPELIKQAYTEYREAGTDPKAIKAVKAKYPQVFGEDPLDKKILEGLKNAGPDGKGKPAQGRAAARELPPKEIEYGRKPLQVRKGPAQYSIEYN